MGIHQLKIVDKYWEQRKNIWKKYNEAFDDLPSITPAEPEPDTRHAYHLYTPLIDIDKLGKMGGKKEIFRMLNGLVNGHCRYRCQQR